VNSKTPVVSLYNQVPSVVVNPIVFPLVPVTGDVAPAGTTNSKITSVGDGVLPSDNKSSANTSIETAVPKALSKSSLSFAIGATTVYSTVIVATFDVSPSSSSIVYEIGSGLPV